MSGQQIVVYAYSYNILSIRSGMTHYGSLYKCSAHCTLGCADDDTIWSRTIGSCTYEELFDKMRATFERGEQFCRNQLQCSLSAVFDSPSHGIRKQNARIVRLLFACEFEHFDREPWFFGSDNDVLAVCLANNARFDAIHQLLNAIRRKLWSQVALFTAAGVVLNPSVDFSDYYGSPRLDLKEAYERIVVGHAVRSKHWRLRLKKERRLVEYVRFKLIQRHAFAICVALQGLELPALVTLFLLDAVFENFPVVQVHLKYRFITLIKHSIS